MFDIAPSELQNMPLGKALSSIATPILAILSLGAVKSSGAAKRKGRKRSGPMGHLFSVFALLVVGIAIVFAAVWYALAVRDWWLAERGSYVLGEIEVVGAPELADTYKKVLPRIISARLAKIRNEANDALQSLDQARARRSGDAQPTSREHVPIGHLPRPFSEPFDVNLKIAEVDVGPILSLLGRATQRQDELEITVSINPGSNTAQIYGYLPGEAGYSFTESIGDQSPDSMADAAAAAIMAEILKQRDPTLAALGALEFNRILTILTEYASHLRGVTIRGEPTQRDLRKLNGRLKEIAPHFPRWRSLQWVAAEVAEGAEEWEDLVVYVENLLAIGSAADEDLEHLEEKLNVARQEQKNSQDVRIVAAERGVSEKEALEEQSRANRVAASRTVEPERAASILKLIAMDEPADAGDQRIGIVGMPWDEVVEHLKSDGIDVKILGGAPPRDLDAGIADYITELVQTVRLVANKPKFVFVPLTGTEQGRMVTSDLVRALRFLRGNSDVVLYAYGSQEQSAMMDGELARLALGHSVVLSAGNRPGQSVYSEIADKVFLAGAVDLSGRTAPFSSTGSDLFWAPGAEIPVVSSRTGDSEQRSGTAYSAAITAAVVAVLKQRFPNVAPEALRSILAATSKPIEGGDGPPVINVQSAIEALQVALVHLEE